MQWCVYCVCAEKLQKDVDAAGDAVERKRAATAIRRQLLDMNMRDSKAAQLAWVICQEGDTFAAGLLKWMSGAAPPPLPPQQQSQEGSAAAAAQRAAASSALQQQVGKPRSAHAARHAGYFDLAQPISGPLEAGLFMVLRHMYASNPGLFGAPDQGAHGAAGQQQQQPQQQGRQRQQSLRRHDKALMKKLTADDYKRITSVWNGIWAADRSGPCCLPASVTPKMTRHLKQFDKKITARQVQLQVLTEPLVSLCQQGDVQGAIRAAEQQGAVLGITPSGQCSCSHKRRGPGRRTCSAAPNAAGSSGVCCSLGCCGSTGAGQRGRHQRHAGAFSRCRHQQHAGAFRWR
jgi:hypothetical protein